MSVEQVLRRPSLLCLLAVWEFKECIFFSKWIRLLTNTVPIYKVKKNSVFLFCDVVVVQRQPYLCW